MGLAEAGREAMEAPEILLTVYGPSGSELTRQTIALPIEVLPAGAGWPFSLKVSSPSEPTSAQAVLQGAAAADPSAPRASAEVLETFLDTQGASQLLGRVRVDGDLPFEVVSLGVLGRDRSGKITDVLGAEPAGANDPGHRETPFLARVPAGSRASTWTAFPIARSLEHAPPPVDVTPGEAMSDDQGNPFLTVHLRNPGQDPLWVRATAVLKADGEWQAGEAIVLPVPLGPGLSTAISFLVPGSPPNPELPTSWETFVDARAADASPVPLASEVVGYEPVGSALLIRVRTEVPVSQEMERAGVSAVLRSESGPIVSASWAAASDLAAGDAPIVVLALPLPDGFDLTASILDVEALGLLAAP